MDRKQKFDQGDVHVMTTPDMLRLVDKIQAVCTLYCDKVALNVTGLPLKRIFCKK